MMQQIPFVIGAQQPELGNDLLNRFVTGVYQILPMSDRMGVRFRGSPLTSTCQSLISEGVCLGAIQLPADGQPIVMLNDHQTIGGYPKIGAVTRLGVYALGQCRPGSLVRFHLISAEEATVRARKHEQWLTAVEQMFVGQNA
jgi:allophanate hydrolase subunit 2